MKKDLCELVIIIDDSGSMQHVADKTISGFNEFLETHQKLPGEALLTLVKFNTNYEIVHNGVNIEDVPKLNKNTYQPHGMTALLDAVGRSIDEVGKRYDAMSEEDRPAQVIFMIMTDGEENSSEEYNLEQIKEKTKKRQDENKWEFVFMGADQNAWTAGHSMGLFQNVNYTVSDTHNVFAKAAYYSANSRMYSKEKSMKNFDLSDDDVKRGLNDLTKNQDNTPKS